MKKIALLTIFLLLSACQPDKAETQTTENKSVDSTANSQPRALQENPPAEFSLTPKQPYEVLESDETCNQPEVMEFFAYQCPHCYKLEPFAEKWLQQKSANIKFISVPTHLGHKEFGSFLIVHQTAIGLGMLDQVTLKLFERIHKQKKGFNSQVDAVNFLVAAGADEHQALKEIQNGEKIKTAMDNNFKLLAQYKITGVPTIVVNKKYKFSVSQAGGYDKVFDMVEETLKLPSNCSK
ncbi:MAG: thiol:disulfide interchange protein DsbA/DsbL [Enterobacterales bacterium]|nr:thiol:disulfide interchange protein DsbA/DsbL [Enterobacterales bacterium]